jgi:hypothetical protein
MRKNHKWLAACAAAVLVACPMAGTMTASATSVGDVIAAAYAAGWPDWMVQSAVNQFGGGNYTSDQCDKAISQIYQYDETVGKQIEAEMGITPPSASTTTAAAGTTESSSGNSGNGSTTTTASGSTASGNGNNSSTQSRPSNQDFINMTLEEKKAYLNGLSESEKTEFVNTMTSSERNSIIKQLGTEDKAALLQSFMSVGEEFGISFDVEELTDDNVVVRARDADGNLVNVTSMGITIDATGYSYTVPIAAAAGLMLLSVGGIAVLIHKSKRHDAE